MKKFLVVLIALLFATGAFAQEAKKAAEFKYGIAAVSYGDSASYKGGKDKLAYDYAHFRVRPTFSVGNENVQGIVTFEIDQDFGANSKTQDDDGDVARTSADPGTDNKDVEVKHAYLAVKDVFIPGLSINTGLNAFYAPLLIDNDFGMSQVGYDFGMGKVNFSYIKLAENYVYNKADSATIKDDVDTYAVDLSIKADPVTIKPAFLYTTFGKNNLVKNDNKAATELMTFADGAIWAAGINAAGEFGALGFNASYAQTGGKAFMVTEGATTGTTSITAEKQKVSTYAVDFLVTFKVEPAKIGAFVTMYSGDDKADNKINSHIALMDNVYGYAPDGRLFVLDAAGVAAKGGYQPFNIGNETSGLKIFGLNAEAVFGKAAVFAQYGYVQTAKKYVNDLGQKKSSVGQEIDLKAAYEIAPATSLFLEYSYVMLTKDYNGTDSTGKLVKGTISEIAWGVSAKI